MRKPVFGVSDQVQHNRVVQLHEIARDSKIQSWEREVMYYLCCEKKGADQLHSYHVADLSLCFLICKKQVFT